MDRSPLNMYTSTYLNKQKGQ